MGLRERVQQAIAGPVGESEKLLNDLPTADAETKLSILVSGWGRGLSAALEELAIAIDDLQGQRTTETPAATPPSKQAETPAATPPSKQAEETSSEPTERTDLTNADEAQLIDEARKSREETADAREKAKQARRQLEQ
jgi:hypothetical protein